MMTICIFSFLPINILSLSHQQGIIIIQPYFNSIDFSLRWTHSVEKEDWEEFFSIEDDEITLTSTRFKTFGAGVPDHAGKDTFIDGGWVYMTKIHQSIGTTLRFQTGKDTNHRFIMKDRTLSLQPQTSYQVEVKSVPFYQLVIIKFFN